jgi:hypothetical protein
MPRKIYRQKPVVPARPKMLGIKQAPSKDVFVLIVFHLIWIEQIPVGAHRQRVDGPGASVHLDGGGLQRVPSESPRIRSGDIMQICVLATVISKMLVHDYYLCCSCGVVWLTLCSPGNCGRSFLHLTHLCTKYLLPGDLQYLAGYDL